RLERIDGLGRHRARRPFEPLDSECFEHASGGRFLGLAELEGQAIEELPLFARHGATITLGNVRRLVVAAAEPFGFARVRSVVRCTSRVLVLVCAESSTVRVAASFADAYGACAEFLDRYFADVHGEAECPGDGARFGDANDVARNLVVHVVGSRVTSS